MYLIQNTLSVKKGALRMKRIEIKMGGQGRCSDSADENFNNHHSGRKTLTA